MITGTTFDKGKNILETFKSIRERGIPIPKDLNQTTKRIIQSMLMYNHSKRSTCEQILN